MKKLLAIMLAALLIFAMISCSKQDEADDTAEGEENAALNEENVYEDFKYGVNENGEIEITGYTYTGEELANVEIPSEIDGRSVVGIGNDAFKAHKNIASVSIPDSILYIGEYAFAQCEYISEITLPENLTNIGTGAFKDCSKLKSVSFPASLLEIGTGAFKNCSALDTLKLPEGLLTIDDSAFWGCSSLKSVTIPDSVIDLGDGAFYLCTSLVEVNILGDISTADDAILTKMNAALAGKDVETLDDAVAVLEEAGFFLGGLSDKGAKYVWDTEAVYGTFTKADETTLKAINDAIKDSDCDSLEEIDLILKGAGLSLSKLNTSIGSDKFVWDAGKKAFTTVYFGESVFEGCTVNTMISVTEGTFFAEMVRAKGYITIVPATAPEGTKIFSNNTIQFYYPEDWAILTNSNSLSVGFTAEKAQVELFAMERNLEDDHTEWGADKLDGYFSDELAGGEVIFTNKSIKNYTNANGVTMTILSATVSDEEDSGVMSYYYITVGNTTYVMVVLVEDVNNTTLIENSLLDIR